MADIKSFKEFIKHPFRSKKLGQVVQAANVAGASTSPSPDRPLPSKPGHGSGTAPPDTDNLWELAFWKLDQDAESKKLLVAYESWLAEDTDTSSAVVSTDSLFASPQRNVKLKEVLDRKSKDAEDSRLKFDLAGHEIEIAPLVDKVVSSIIWFKESIGDALPPDPYVSVAWTGVCVLLPLVLNAGVQRKNAIAGLDAISNILCRSAVVDNLYQNICADTPPLLELKKHFKEKRIDLYSKILDYQMKRVCQLSRHPVFAYVFDVIRNDDWGSLLANINAASALSDQDRQLLHEQKLDDGIALQKEKIDEALQSLRSIAKQIKDLGEKEDQHHISSMQTEILETLRNELEYEKFKDDRNPPKTPGTGEWLLNDLEFQKWSRNGTSGILLLSAGPGCGKSVLARSLIDNELKKDAPSDRSICHFFFKDDNAEQKSAKNALCAILHQLFTKMPHLIRHAQKEYRVNGASLSRLFDKLWGIFEDITSDETSGEIVCVLDALDECEAGSREHLLECIKGLTAWNKTKHKLRLKILLTSRPYYAVEQALEGPQNILPSFHIDVERTNPSMAHEIELVIKDNVCKLGSKFSEKWKSILQSQPLKVAEPDRTFLWVYLVFQEVKRLAKRRASEVEISNKAVFSVPNSVFEAYDKILARIEPGEKESVRRLLHLVLIAKRPLTLSELNIASHIKEGTLNIEDLQLPPDAEFGARILEQCQFFLRISGQISGGSEVSLIHQTAREFLQPDDTTTEFPRIVLDSNIWQHSFVPTESHALMARACIYYLFLRDFGDEWFWEAFLHRESRPPYGDPVKWVLHRLGDDFYSWAYSRNCWPLHYRHIPPEKRMILENYVQELNKSSFSEGSFIIDPLRRIRFIRQLAGTD